MNLNKLYLRYSFQSFNINTFIQIMSCKVVNQWYLKCLLQASELTVQYTEMKPSFQIFRLQNNGNIIMKA